MTKTYPSLTVCVGKSSIVDHAALSSALQQIQQQFFNETGVVIPLIQLRDGDDLDGRTCHLLMNESPLITFPQLDTSEFWVPLGAAEVTGTRFGRTWTAREQQLPGAGAPGSVVQGDAAARLLWTNQRYTAIASVEYIAAAIYSTIKKHAVELLVQDLVDHYLFRLKEKSSVLVEVARHCFKLEDLTLALRSALGTSGSIKNLPAILGQLLAAQVVD
jgi:flagellar biosynthesis component FlhA